VRVVSCCLVTADLTKQLSKNNNHLIDLKSAVTKKACHTIFFFGSGGYCEVD